MTGVGNPPTPLTGLAQYCAGFRLERTAFTMRCGYGLVKIYKGIKSLDQPRGGHRKGLIQGVKDTTKGLITDNNVNLSHKGVDLIHTP